MSDPITCASGKTHNQINNWRGAALKWQLLFIDLFLQVEIERCKLQVNEISWVRFFSSNTVNNCCPLMHILVLLQANFLNINKKPIQMKRKPWELVQNFLPHSSSNQRNTCFRSERKGDSLICSSISPSGITERSKLTKLQQINLTRLWYLWVKKPNQGRARYSVPKSHHNSLDYAISYCQTGLQAHFPLPSSDPGMLCSEGGKQGPDTYE